MFEQLRRRRQAQIFVEIHFSRERVGAVFLVHFEGGTQAFEGLLRLLCRWPKACAHRVG